MIETGSLFKSLIRKLNNLLSPKKENNEKVLRDDTMDVNQHGSYGSYVSTLPTTPMPVSTGTSIGTKMSSSTANVNFGERHNGMHFIIYTAIGGKIVEFSLYDSNRDKLIKNLYIITDKEDLGEEISQIITKESLSR